MTDKIQQARRAAFEQWAERHRMPIGRDGVVVDYSARETDACWQAFNAALDCVVIELPQLIGLNESFQGTPISEIRAQNHYNGAVMQCRTAIESTSLGIKVK